MPSQARDESPAQRPAISPLAVPSALIRTEAARSMSRSTPRSTPRSPAARTNRRRATAPKTQVRQSSASSSDQPPSSLSHPLARATGESSRLASVSPTAEEADVIPPSLMAYTSYLDARIKSVEEWSAAKSDRALCLELLESPELPVDIKADCHYALASMGHEFDHHAPEAERWLNWLGARYPNLTEVQHRLQCIRDALDQSKFDEQEDGWSAGDILSWHLQNT